MLTVIGCGNIHRSDDGVGVVVAQRLRQALARTPSAPARAIVAGANGIEVMLEARGSEALLVIDACRGGGAAGTIRVLSGAQLVEERRPTFSMHDFRWTQALALGRRVLGDAFPPEVTVWLVEAGCLDVGVELSPAVASAADALCERALALVAEMRSDAG